MEKDRTRISASMGTVQSDFDMVQKQKRRKIRIGVCPWTMKSSSPFIAAASCRFRKLVWDVNFARYLGFGIAGLDLLIDSRMIVD
jgi:hypothetical protein